MKIVNQQVLHPSTLVVGKDLKVVLESQFAMLKNYVYILKKCKIMSPSPCSRKKIMSVIFIRKTTEIFIFSKNVNEFTLIFPHTLSKTICLYAGISVPAS